MRKTFLVITVSLFVLIPLMTLPQPQASNDPHLSTVGWSHYPGLGGNNRQICRDNQGNIHVVYYHDPHTVTYAKSVDEGMTWHSHDISTTTSVGGIGPAIAWSGVALYAFWQNNTIDAGAGETTIELWKSIDRGETWVQQTVPPIIANWGATFAATGNNVYIAYMAAGWNTEIRFIKSSDGGLTWGPEKTISQPDNNWPAIAVDGVGDGNDKIYLAFAADPGWPGLFFASSSDGGTTWGSVKTLDSTLHHYHVDITFSSSHVYVVSSPGDEQRVSFSSSPDYGQTWSFTENIDQRASPEDLAYVPTITLSDDHCPLVFYCQDEGKTGHWNIVCREWNGTGWKDEVKVTDDDLNNYDPSSKYSASYNKVEVIWVRGHVEPYEIVYSFEPTIRWEYVFEDPCRSTVLKISTDDQYFQFIAPGKEFPIKHDPSMRVAQYRYFTCIAICFEDEEIRLSACAVDGRFDSCIACAKNMQTGKTYLLIDKPGKE